jgi:uncharacterized protein involved in exopolysaccharide biosynthesis
MLNQEHRTDPAAYAGIGDTPYGLKNEVSLFEIVSALLRQRSVFVRTLVLVSGITFLFVFTRPPRYTSSASFVPETSDSQAAGMLSLAQEFGIPMGVGSSERSPEFYEALVTSSEILRQIVVERHPVRDSEAESGEINLIEYYEVDEETEVGRIERAMEELIEGDLEVTTDRDAGIVSFSITTEDSLLSYGVVAHLLSLVNDFDLNTRQSQAGSERVFTGERLAQQEEELRQAEDNLQGFLIENRVINDSPFLQFERDRFERAVEMQQELVTSLAQSFERARIEEVRNIPVITIINSPHVPGLRDRLRIVLTIIMGIMFGAACGAFAVFFRTYMEQPDDTRPSDLQELASVWSDTKTDLRRFLPWPFRRSGLSRADVSVPEPESPLPANSGFPLDL